MFATFLLGILLMTSLVMIVLLVAPTRDNAPRLPVVGIIVGLMLTFLAFLSGFAVAG